MQEIPSWTSSESSASIYRQCLVDLTRHFMEIVKRLQRETFDGFRVGRRPYPFRVLHLRNVEFLAVAAINLQATGYNLPNVIKICAKVASVSKIKVYCSFFGLTVEQAFETGGIKADYLKHKSISELATKLVTAEMKKQVEAQVSEVLNI